MKIKTSDLIGAQLDWAVAKAADIAFFQMGANWPGNSAVNEAVRLRPVVIMDLMGKMRFEAGFCHIAWAPSVDWGQGGPLIEKYDPDERRTGLPSGCRFAEVWVDFNGDDARRGHGNGETRLIAFCRALVAAKLGEEIEVPEELV